MEKKQRSNKVLDIVILKAIRLFNILRLGSNYKNFITKQSYFNHLINFYHKKKGYKSPFSFNYRCVYILNRLTTLSNSPVKRFKSSLAVKTSVASPAFFSEIVLISTILRLISSATPVCSSAAVAI